MSTYNLNLVPLLRSNHLKRTRFIQSVTFGHAAHALVSYIYSRLKPDSKEVKIVICEDQKINASSFIRISYYSCWFLQLVGLLNKKIYI